MRTFVLALLVGCAPTAMTTNAEHPANPDAPTGRLAGPPAALRPGVADLSKPTPTATDHSIHGSGAASEHAGHGEQPAPDGPAKAEPEPATSEPKSEPAKKPAETPRKQTKPPASGQAPAETSTDTPKQPPPPAPRGHEGHH